MNTSLPLSTWKSDLANPNQRLAKLRWLLAAITLLSLVTLIVLITLGYGTGPLLGHFTRGRLIRMIPTLLGVISAGTLWLVSYRSQAHQPMLDGVDTLGQYAVRARWLCGFAYFSLPAIYLWIFWGPYQVQFTYVAPRLAMLGYFVLLGALLLRGARPRVAIALSLVATVLFFTVFYEAALQFQVVSSYPLSVGWSESSRFYYASLFFSGQVYGGAAPLPFLHPSRYLLQSLPFLVPGLSLWFHRFWQALLWVGMTGWTGYLLARRMQIQNRLVRWSFAGWLFLFLLQGPVYYQLLVCVILVVWGFNPEKFGRSLVFILLASAWAGISRVNWFPVPGLLATALYFLEVKRASKSIWRYLLPPSIWVGSGLAAALLAQSLYRALSGNPPFVFDTSFRSALLWYRLLPTPTYGSGVLLELAMVALPVLVFMGIKLWQTRAAWHPLRLAGLGAILVVLLGGGIVVSAKIGGGANLHNLDAFLVVLAVIAGSMFWNRFESEATRPPVRIRWNQVFLVLLLIQPIWSINSQGESFSPPDSQAAEEAIASLQKQVDAAGQQPGEILFISQRHLLTFHRITGVSLIPEYEKVDLMEMAMANNQPYLQAFTQDLKNQRFSMIVTDELNLFYQDDTHEFAEENNAWVRSVARKINAYYQKSDVLVDRIEVLTPRP